MDKGVGNEFARMGGGESRKQGGSMQRSGITWKRVVIQRLHFQQHVIQGENKHYLKRRNFFQLYLEVSESTSPSHHSGRKFSLCCHHACSSSITKVQQSPWVLTRSILEPWQSLSSPCALLFTQYVCLPCTVPVPQDLKPHGPESKIPRCPLQTIPSGNHPPPLLQGKKCFLSLYFLSLPQPPSLTTLGEAFSSSSDVSAFLHRFFSP